MKYLPRLIALGALLITPVLAFAKFDPPVPVRMVAPKYPQNLRRDGVMGIVVVACTVDTHGNVANPQVIKSTNDGFNQPALEALKQWKFKPAQQDGTPVARKVDIPLRFILNN